MDDKTIKNLLL